MKATYRRSRPRHAASALSALILPAALSCLAAPPGPEVQVPEGGGAPGAYPNTSVTAANLLVRGGSTYDSNVEIPGFEGQGPIPWSVNRYNRGDIALRLAPADPAAAAGSLNQGYIEFADTSPGLAASQAWRPTPTRGVVIPTSRQNGPIDWSDGEPPFFPTIAVSQSSSAPGYDMVTGAYGNGNLDINTGRAGTHESGAEANFGFSVTWFPYDQGWIGGQVGTPIVGDPAIPDGTAQWAQPNAHAAGLAAGLVDWVDYPEGSQTFGGVATLRLPGVNSLEDGMLFASSADGNSDVNIVGVAPNEDGNGWRITIREDSAIDAETLAEAGQSEFEFVYVPYDAQRLIGGYIAGTDGSKRKAVGEFTVTRTGVGTYELTIPGKNATSGTLLLQAAAFESGTTEPLATRAFLSYAYSNDRFVIQSRVTTSDTAADLSDVDFYVVWVDFAEPLAMPAGPRLRSLDPVVVNAPDVRVSEAGIAAHTTEPEVLVTTLDLDNVGGYTDPITGEAAASAVVGRFYDPRTLTATTEPFVILGNPTGIFGRHDVKFNPVSKQYVVVATSRTYGPGLHAVPLIALVNPASVAAGESPVAKAFAYREDTEIDFEDIAVAINTRNGSFMIAAEYKVPDEGEATVGAMFDVAGAILTPDVTRLDVLQSIGDEDDPDLIYLEDRDAYLYLSNTDNSNGSTGPYANRVAGSLVDPAPNAQGQLVTRPEQALADGLPAGVAEGHPAALLNPFNGQIITAFDAGNGTPTGDLSFTTIGPAPAFEFTQAKPEIPYLAGSNGDPFLHQHPQLAADPEHGVIVVGMNANSSAVGYPDAYAFVLLGPDGSPLPGQLKAPYFLADARGGLGNTVNFHNIKYSPTSDSFVVAYTTTSPTTTYLASLQVTSNHLESGGEPTLSIQRSGTDVAISWPVTEGFVLQSSSALGTTAVWAPVAGAPVTANGTNTVTVTPAGSAQFYRLAKP